MHSKLEWFGWLTGWLDFIPFESVCFFVSFAARCTMREHTHILARQSVIMHSVWCVAHSTKKASAKTANIIPLQLRSTEVKNEENKKAKQITILRGVQKEWRTERKTPTTTATMAKANLYTNEEIISDLHLLSSPVCIWSCLPPSQSKQMRDKYTANFDSTTVYVNVVRAPARRLVSP